MTKKIFTVSDLNISTQGKLPDIQENELKQAIFVIFSVILERMEKDYGYVIQEGDSIASKDNAFPVLKGTIDRLSDMVRIYVNSDAITVSVTYR